MLSTSPYVIQLNTTSRRSTTRGPATPIYYATDTEAIRKGLFNNRYPTSQTFTGPGGLFYKPTVPGYKTFDLEKAKQLVSEIGGLQIKLGTINVLVAKQTTEALQSQWAKAGIKTKIESYDLAGLIKAFGGRGSRCCRRPAHGIRRSAWASRSGSTRHSPFSGVKDPELDKLLDEAAATLDEDKRQTLYDEAGKSSATSPTPRSCSRSPRRTSPSRACTARA